MNPEDKKLQKLQSLLELANQDTVTPDDLTEVITFVVDTLKAYSEKTDTASQEIRGAFNNAVVELQNRSQELLQQLSTERTAITEDLSNRITDALGKIETYLAIPVKNGIDGMTPIKGVDYFDGENGSPDMAEDIRNKLELLEGDERLDKKAIKGLEVFIDQPILDRAIGILDSRTSFLVQKVSNLSSEVNTIPGGTVTSLTAGTGITLSPSTITTTGSITNNLSTGVSGGQSVIGGTASGDNLTLSSTSNGTKGKIFFGANSAYDDSNDRLGIGTANPSALFTVSSSSTTATTIAIENTDTGGASWALRSTGSALSGGAGNLRFDTPLGNARVIFTSTGSVGIGTTTPNNSLQIKTGTDGGGITIQRNSTTADTYADIGWLMSTTDSSVPTSSIRVYRRSAFDNNDMVFNVGGNVAMTILDSGNVGIGTIAPTHTLTLASSSTGLSAYNTADQTVNYERAREYWTGNVYTIATEQGGTGGFRGIALTTAGTGGSSSTLSVSRTSSMPFLDFTYAGTGIAGSAVNIRGGLSASSGIQNQLAIVPTVTQTGTASFRALFISPFESSVGSGFDLLADFGTNSAANGGGTHTTRFAVTDTGLVGINLNNPTTLIEAYQPTTNAQSYAQFTTVNTGQGVGHGLTVGYNSTAGEATVYNRENTSLTLGTNNSRRIIIQNSGKVSIGDFTATAMLHLKAGTATAGTAPLKLTAGTNLSVTEAGAIEYDGTHLYFTAANAGTRYQLDQQSGSGITRSVNTVSTSTAAGATAATDYVYLVTGTSTITLPTAAGNTNLYTVKRNGTNTVTVATTGGQTIDGAATQTLLTQYESMDFISDGSNWASL